MLAYVPSAKSQEQIFNVDPKFIWVGHIQLQCACTWTRMRGLAGVMCPLHHACNFAYQVLPLYCVQYWKGGSGLETRLLLRLNTIKFVQIERWWMISWLSYLIRGGMTSITSDMAWTVMFRVAVVMIRLDLASYFNYHLFTNLSWDNLTAAHAQYTEKY